jgi:hypothetical protein
MKKDEENILNKKKKREESKQKNKAEKNKNINNTIQNYSSNMNQINQYQYELLKRNYSYPNQMMIHNSFYSFIENKKTNDNNIYSFIESKKDIVNHIMGAFYILKDQQNKSKNLEKKNNSLKHCHTR